MNDKKKVMPMAISGVGGPQQQPFDLSQAEQKICNGCKSELFEKVFRMGLVSKFAPGNKTQIDITVEYPTYVCINCGLEISKETEKK